MHSITYFLILQLHHTCHLVLNAYLMTSPNAQRLQYIHAVQHTLMYLMSVSLSFKYLDPSFSHFNKIYAPQLFWFKVKQNALKIFFLVIHIHATYYVAHHTRCSRIGSFGRSLWVSRQSMSRSRPTPSNKIINTSLLTLIKYTMFIHTHYTIHTLIPSTIRYTKLHCTTHLQPAYPHNSPHPHTISVLLFR